MPSPCVPPVPPALFMRLHPPCMPPIRTGNETVDDQRVLEVEHAPQMVNYTFLNQRSPPPTDMESIDSIFTSAHDNSLPTTPQRTSHGKRRDASYIPRPPNAFILFRSSFIRDQKVTNKVEGNHSNLSKIIGMYWKTLTKEQRDEWEVKAAQALIEHRKRYPDWRFSPATNAGTNGKLKVRITDGVRRGRARKDPPDRGGGGGEEELEEGPRRGRTMTRVADEESRLTKIAGLLVQGQEGEALERAVEEWEAGRRRSESTSISASSSPVVTRASASASTESIPPSPVITRAHASSTLGSDPPPTSASLSSRESFSPVMTRASSMERPPLTPVSAPSDSFVDTLSTSKDVLAPSLPITSRLSTTRSSLRSVTIPRPPPSWPASPITPQAIPSSPLTPIHWPVSPVNPRISTSSPAFTPAEEWDFGYKIARTTSTSISMSTPVSSPVMTRASASTPNGQLSTLAPSPCIYTTSTRKDVPSSSSHSTPRQPMSTSTSTLTPTPTRPVSIPKPPPPSSWPASPIIPQALGSTASASTPGSLSTPFSSPSRPVTIPRPPPLWPASPSTPQALASPPPTPGHWPSSPVAPRISASFPSFTSAEEWEVGYKIARSTSISMSELAASSPIVTRASAAATDGEPAVLDRSISVSASALGSPIISRPPASNPSWPASPITSRALASSAAPIVARTHVPNHTWSTVPNSPATHLSTSTSPRRPRSRSRSPTFKSPQNPSATIGAKRSLSAPAPYRDHHRQQEPVRTDTGFWWPAPEEREYSHEQRPEEMGVAMEMGMGVAEPTRDGSFDVFSAQDQETEHESVIVNRDTNEWAWGWPETEADPKSTSIYSSIPFTDQTTLGSTPTDPQLHLDLPPRHERWFNPWDADTAIHAGDYIHPPPPTPISPLSLSSFSGQSQTHTHTTTRATRSSFSSLAGWDGTSTEPANADVSGACAPAKASGIGAMVWDGNGLQRLGVQGGGYGEGCQWVE